MLSKSSSKLSLDDLHSVRDQDFYKMLSEDPARAFYGPGHVFAAAEIGAIQVGALLLCQCCML